MIAQTSNEAYVEYQRLVKLEEKLKKGNRGLNIINAEEFFKSKRFRIEVKKITEANLLEVKSEIVVNTNFPFADWRYSYEQIGVEEFLNQLKEWVSTPRYKFFIQHNRKRDNQASWWDLPKFKKFNVQFEEVDIDIGKCAEHELNLMSLNFVEEVKELLSQQREATEEESEDFEKYRLLLEKKGNLKRRLPKSNYSYGNEDKTLGISIDKKTFNEKLKSVEQELQKLCKKYPFLEMPSIDYQKILTQLSFKDWKAENNYDAEDEWSNFTDEDKEEYDGDFENFLKWCYEQYIESNDFDE